MPKIQVLDKKVAELIAAGEVVERPSSVIKELVENAVDSGASVITVEIRNGGVTFMRVTDNGCGIPAQEVPTAFLRHATSKVKKQDDLYSIATLGFRGEALASISAVSHVEMLTRARGEDLGVRYTGGGNEEYTLEEAGCPEGTTFLVRDLFYNTPARMKFLKKDSTEGNAVAGILDKMALSHPEISFRFLRDGKEVLHTPGDSRLSSAIYTVYGKEFFSSLIPVDYELGHVKVGGFVSAPAGCRPNRSMQNFFINGRFIKSRTAMAALEEAYKGSVMAGKFPACVLHLSLSFEAVDVNVHPAKLEVRFVNERPIFDAVYHGVKSALLSGDKTKVMTFRKPPIELEAPVERAPQLKLDLSEAPHREKPVLKEPLRAGEIKPVSPLSFEGREQLLRDGGAREVSSPAPKEFEAYLNRVIDREPVPRKIQEEKPVFPPEEQAPPKQQEPPKEEQASLWELASSRELSHRIIGEAFGTYLILEYGPDSLMLIDKHAAHERLLYEKLKARNIGTDAQELLEPVPVTLEKDEYSAVLSFREELMKAGFEVDDFGAGTVLVRSVPLLLDGADAAGAVMEIAGKLCSLKTDLTTERLDWVYHNVACRAAMKAGDQTTKEELAALAQALEENPQVRYCPHGRPVYILIKRRDLERQFGRA